MSTQRAKRLETLAMNLSGANKKVAEQQQQARSLGLQQFAKNASPQTTSAQLVQAGAQSAQNAQNIALQQQQQTAASTQAVQQEALQQKQAGLTQQAREDQLSLDKSQMESAATLARLDQSLKNKLLDEQLKFNTDQAGRQVLNERQLADWAATQARDLEEFKNYQQIVDQTTRRELQVYEAAHRQITQTLEQGYVKGKQSLDQEHRLKLEQQKQQLEKTIKEKQQNAANRASMWQAAGTIVGAGVGLIFGPAGSVAGAALGASIGSGVGTAAGSLSERMRG